MTVEEIDKGAVQMLRYPTLEADYADAWTLWSGDDRQSYLSLDISLSTPG